MPCKLASKFVKPEIIRKLKDDKSCFSKLETGLANQKDDKDLTIGNMTSPKFRRALEESDINESDVDMFYDAVREFLKPLTVTVSNGYLWMTLYTREASSLNSQI